MSGGEKLRSEEGIEELGFLAAWLASTEREGRRVLMLPCLLHLVDFLWAVGEANPCAPSHTGSTTTALLSTVPGTSIMRHRKDN